MPRISSARAKILRDLRETVDGRKQNSLFRQQHMAEFSDYDSNVAMVEDFIDDIVIDAEQQLSAERYFFLKKKVRNRRELFDWEDCINPNSLYLHDEEFLLLFRVSRPVFN